MNKYFWFKFKSDFFEDETIDYILEQENGEEILIFYLKILAKSLEKNGKLFRKLGEKNISFDEKSLANYTKTKLKIVKKSLKILQDLNLIKILENGEIVLIKLDEMIGSETKDALKKRNYRAKKEDEKVDKQEDKERTNKGTMSTTDNKIYRDIDIKEKIDKKENSAITLLLKTGNEYPISEEDIKGWQMTYKGVDVKQELLLMREWCKANPQKRKTESGILRFITSWLAREQKQTQVKSKDTPPVYDDSKNRKYDVNDDDILEMIQEEL